MNKSQINISNAAEMLNCMPLNGPNKYSSNCNTAPNQRCFTQIYQRALFLTQQFKCLTEAWARNDGGQQHNWMRSKCDLDAVIRLDRNASAQPLKFLAYDFSQYLEKWRSSATRRLQLIINIK